MLGRFYFLLALFFHTFQTVLIKKIPAISDFKLWDLLFLRNLISFLLLNIILLFLYSFSKDKQKFSQKILGPSVPMTIAKKKEVASFVFKSILTFLPTSLLTITTSFLWHFGVKHVPVNNAVIISYLSIILIPLMSKQIFKERNSNVFLLSVIILLATFTFFNRKLIIGTFNFYYFIIILDVFLFSLLTFQRKINTNKFHPIKILYFVWLSVTIISFIFTDNVFIKLSKIAGIQEFLLLFMAFIFYFLEFVLRIFSIQLSNIKYLEPLKFFRFIYAAILSYLFLRENLLERQILSILVIIVFNILLFQIEKREKSLKNAIKS